MQISSCWLSVTQVNLQHEPSKCLNVEVMNIIDNVYVWTHAIWLAGECDEVETGGLFEKQMAYECACLYI
jgi:hypothetical protein